jgi:hypothetical protein
VDLVPHPERNKIRGIEMILSVFERLLLRNIMPQIQGNFGHIKEAREVIESLFTPEEEEALNIRIVEDGRRIEWRTETPDGHPIPQEKEIKISDGLTAKIRRVLQLLDAEEQLKLEHYSLYEKFVGTKEAAKT